MRNVQKYIFLITNLSTTGRIMCVFGVMIACCVAIVITLGKYTIIDHDFYQNLADRQQLRNVELDVNRGTIFATIDPKRTKSTSETASIIATSSVTQDLSIDPSGMCNLDLLETSLKDILYHHLCEGKSQVNCLNNVMKYTNLYEIPPNFLFSKESIITTLTPTLHEQTHRLYKTRINIATGVGPYEMNQLLNIGNPGVTIIGDSVYVDPTRFDASRGVSEIIEILQIDPVILEDALVKRPNKNVDIIERMSPETTSMIQSIIDQEKIHLKKQSLATQAEQESYLRTSTTFKCIKLSDHPVRSYPLGESMAQITGFVDRDGTGRLGIEGYFHDLLAGKSGKKEERVDASKARNAIFDEDAEKEVKGVDLHLTIDPNIQQAVMDALKEGIRRTGANTAAAIVMDPNTGAVRAMGSYPSFDPERPGNADIITRFFPGDHANPAFQLLGKVLFVESPEGNVKKVYQNRFITLIELHDEIEIRSAIANPDNILYVYENNIGLLAHQNIALTSPYEPGSIFKGLTVAIGLDTGEIEPDTLYQDAGSVKVDEFEIKNLVNSSCQGLHTFRNALNFSCNVGMIHIIKRIGKPLFFEYLRKFGFGGNTGLTLDGEHTGTLEPWEKWSGAKLFTMSFGQGIQVNMVQMASIYAAFANKGVMMQPYVVAKREYPDGDIVMTEPVPIRRVVSEGAAEKIIAMLTEGTKVGFAKAGGVDGYAVAGKTGTSQIASSRGGFEAGENGRTNTSFAGFGPSGNPQFVIIVRFDRPRSTQFAEHSSAKTFHDIAKYLFEYYGVPPER